jgi:acyl-CoA-binding protein
MSLISFDQSGSGEAEVGPLSLEAVQRLACDCGFLKAGADASKPLPQRADTAAFFKVLGVNSLSAFKTLFYTTRIPAPRPGQAPPPPVVRKKPDASAAPAVRTRNATALHACRAFPSLLRAAVLTAFLLLLRTRRRAQEANNAGAKSYPVPDVSQFASLAASFESLKWRIIPRPGGATMKPDDYYVIYGARRELVHRCAACGLLSLVLTQNHATCACAAAAKQQAEKGDNTAEKPMWAETGGLDFDGRERWEAWSKMAGMTKGDAQRAFCEAYARAMSREADNFRRF